LHRHLARVAELVDALVSKTNEVTLVPVRFRPRVQNQLTDGFSTVSFFISENDRSPEISASGDDPCPPIDGGGNILNVHELPLHGDVVMGIHVDKMLRGSELLFSRPGI
jgi:hypothetical protein